MDIEALKQNLVDALEEGQLKLGYRSETVQLYYPLSSLCTLLGEQTDAPGMVALLHTFAQAVRPELGALGISQRGERFCLAIPPEGVAHVHDGLDPDGFLAGFIACIARHGCTMREVIAQFERFSDHVCVKQLQDEAFDTLVYFADGVPDSYRYCIADEGEHLTYHRFTKADYDALGIKE